MNFCFECMNNCPIYRPSKTEIACMITSYTDVVVEEAVFREQLVKERILPNT